jgi:hypothetical protein
VWWAVWKTWLPKQNQYLCGCEAGSLPRMPWKCCLWVPLFDNEEKGICWLKLLDLLYLFLNGPGHAHKCVPSCGVPVGGCWLIRNSLNLESFRCGGGGHALPCSCLAFAYSTAAEAGDKQLYRESCLSPES